MLIPPEPLWEPIQAIRQKYDRHYRRWMPHITLLYPFLPPAEFNDYQFELNELCRSIPIFHLQLKKLKFFQHGNYRFTIWVEPEPTEPIRTLAEKLRSLFPDCDDTFRFPAGYTPHLSLGQIRGKENMKESFANLKREWKALNWLVTECHYISRKKPPEDIFKIRASIPFFEI